MPPPTIDRAALSRISYLSYLFVFLSVFALVVKPSPYRRMLFLPLLLMSPYLLSFSTGHPTMDYCVASAWFPYLFAASDYILITDVQRELRMVKPPQRTGEPIETAPLSRRIAWGTQLFTSTRGIGWVHEPRHANPPHPSPSTPRGAFVRAQIAEAVAMAVIFETVNFFNTRNPSLYAGGPSLAAYGWFWRYLVVWAWGLPMATAAIFGHCLNAAFSVGTGASDPEDWPPYMGSLSLAWSLRNFWGRTWHQSMRRFLSAHGKFVAQRVLHLEPRSAGSAYTQIYIAFLISGIMHYLPEYMALRHWGGGALVFFLLQAVAITFEDAVQNVGKCLGIAANWRWKAVGSTPA
ncbi:membrane bound O-acyl transferase family-domain-containing protein [Mycena maculata]|uniref:Membrane bound O-acyl transferase family-domain-containing protein n=1 Tax=Mycena maculata TaxID=230809 RepID=A0AAD7JSC7_9AGAR|nr:membrane bound O-acyl transferase family-domain-containing protein [Mycena maculata]